jgi:hypothetical protein
MLSALQAAIRLWLACTVLSLGYENQQRASLEVCEEFRKGQRYGLLRAALQSGKTGTYQLLIRKMFTEGLIDHAYILCGSHELELLSQVRKDKEEWHGSAPFKDRIHIVFRQNFNKTKMKLKRVLIVVDESHLVTGVHQTLCKFLKRHQLSMSGTTPRMVRDDIYMLSVDATPYLEESVIAYDGGNKFRVILDSGAGYYGVMNYLTDGHLRATWDLGTDAGKRRFKELIVGCPQKYIFVRSQSKNKQLHALLYAASEAGCATLRFTSKEEKQATQVVLTRAEADEHQRVYGRAIPCLEEAPAHTTVVVIDGRLRCGKRVPKMHVGVVWELSKNCNTDTLMQGLLGRMCGYEGEGIYHVPRVKPLVFVAGAMLDKTKNRKKVVDCSELERAILSGVNHGINLEKVCIGPQKVAGLNPGRVQNKKYVGEVEVYPCAPIRFQLTAFQTESLVGATDAYIKTICMGYVQRHPELIDDNPLLTEDQREEISSVVDSWSPNETRGANLRRYSGKSNDSMHKSHVNAVKWSCSATDGISNPERPTFCVTFPDFQPMEGVPMKAGEVFLIAYTRAKGLPHVIPLESRVARHDGTSHFCAPIEDHMAAVPAASVFGFTPDILESAEAFEQQFDEFIGIGLTGRGLYGRSFTALQGGEPIRLPRSIYGSHLEIMKPILSRLQQRHNVTISYKSKPTFPHTPHIEWTSLEWKPKA